MLFASDLSGLVQALMRTDIPALPDAALRPIGVHMLWGILLAAAGWRAGYRLPARWRAGFAALIALWSLIPGPASPAYWLEMAFAAPSWTSALLCVFYLQMHLHQTAGLGEGASGKAPADIPWPWTIAGIALGWVLALDTFALLPLTDSVYAWGFTPLATLVLVLVAASAWLVRPDWATALPVLAIVLYVLTRLPSGNVWDAVTDPLLWLYLHGAVVLRVWRQRNGRRRRLT